MGNPNSVKFSTVKPNIPIAFGLDSDPAQFSYGLNERSIEGLSIGGPCINSGSGSRVSKKDFVRSEQALSILKIFVVRVVECCWCCRIHVNCNRRVNIFGTHFLQLGRVLPVQGWIDRVGPAEIVYPVGKFTAVGKSQCVGACTEQ